MKYNFKAMLNYLAELCVRKVANWPPRGPKSSILAIFKQLGRKEKVIGVVG